MEILSLLTAFGLGSIATAVVQYWLSVHQTKQKRSFDERKEAYVGLLNAYHRAAVEQTEAAAKEFAYWQMRCELVAPGPVRRAITRIVETNENPSERRVAHDELKAQLRRDLGVKNGA